MKIRVVLFGAFANQLMDTMLKHNEKSEKQLSGSNPVCTVFRNRLETWTQGRGRLLSHHEKIEDHFQLMFGVAT